MNIVKKEYWESGYKNYEFNPFPEDHPIVQIINKYLPNAIEESTAFEIGCYPGHILFYFAKKGYKIGGVDLIPDTINIPKFLESFNVNCDDFLIEDINNYETKKKYEVVCSFGFIEHFTNYDEIIKLHLNLVKPNGYVVITTPNFAHSFRFLYQKYFDNENFNRHIVDAMKVKNWVNVIPENYQIISKGYVGNIIWSEKTITLFYVKVIKKILNLFIKMGAYIFKGSKHFSSYSFIVLQNRDIKK